MELSTTEKDRAAGALVGLATGDALGAGYEFQSPGPSDPQMGGGGSFGWKPGEWTDDSQMAICIADVAATGELHAETVGERFLAWYRDRPKDVGIQTRAVLSAAKTGWDLAEAAHDYYLSHPHNAAGNGSLMRTAPVALAHLGDDAAISEVATAISALTHGDPLAGEACALWCIGIDRAVRTGRLDGVGEGLDLLPSESRDRWAKWIRQANTDPPSAFRPNGYVVMAFQAAHAAIHQTPIPRDQPARHLQEALRTAVRIGHDTDTVAGIAGSLLGAAWGATAVPLAWGRLLHGWPGYHHHDLVRLGLLVATRGELDAQGFPVKKRLIPYYLETFHPSGRCVPLREDPGVLIGDVAAVEGEGGEADAVVSLCRMGTEDVQAPEHHEVWLIDQDDPANPNLDFILADVAGFIAERRDEGKTVFVHCVQAESRTPAAAAAYLAHRFGMAGAQALVSVESELSGSHAQPWFRRSLARLWP